MVIRQTDDLEADTALRIANAVMKIFSGAGSGPPTAHVL